MRGTARRLIAACVGLTAFAVAIVSGLAADADAAQILGRSALALIACYVLGWMVGSACVFIFDQQKLSTSKRAAALGAGVAQVPSPTEAPSQNRSAVIV